MTVDPVLSRLAAADPAANAVATPTAEQIEAVKHRRVPGVGGLRGRARRFRYAVTPALGLALVGAVAVVAVRDPVVQPGPAPRLNLAAAAYAQTGQTRGRIAHTLVTAVSTQTADGRVTRRERVREESWIYGSESHHVQSITSPGRRPLITDHIIGADGVMRHLDGFSNYRIVRPSDNQDSADVIAREQNGFVAEFRKSYEQGVLDPAEDTRYAGRPARRYVVRGTQRQPPGAAQSFYLDRETGAPLGMVNVLRAQTGRTPSESRTTTFRFESIVRKVESLPATKSNLRDLRTPTVVRRRDSNGCIRAAVKRARTADSARKYDCGGTPDGPVSEP